MSFEHNSYLKLHNYESAIVILIIIVVHYVRLFTDGSVTSYCNFLNKNNNFIKLIKTCKIIISITVYILNIKQFINIFSLYYNVLYPISKDISFPLTTYAKTNQSLCENLITFYAPYVPAIYFFVWNSGDKLGINALWWKFSPKCLDTV